MILNIDAKGIEWVAAVYWSQDALGIQELQQEFDIHGDNQTRFKLPSRLAAKTLLFRTIYGGTGYSFATDPEFSHLGGESWWDEKIASFYEKYTGLRSWHDRLYERVVLNNGRLDLQTGRSYTFKSSIYRGEAKYPRTKILNYPVQGLAADLMAITRVSLRKRLKALNLNGLLWVNTVHDSIVLDIMPEIWYNTSSEIVNVVEDVFRDIPLNFKKLFDLDFNVPVRCEVTFGPDWGKLEEYHESESNHAECSA